MKHRVAKFPSNEREDL